MGKGIDIIGNAKKTSGASLVNKTGWFEEKERHSRAAKTGHAGGKYATDGSGLSAGKSGGCSENKRAGLASPRGAKSTGGSKTSKSIFNKFCDVCGKPLG